MAIANQPAAGNGIVRLRSESALSTQDRERLAKLAAEIVASWPPLDDDERRRLRALLGRDDLDAIAMAA